jgi:2-haloacid dehalogenase
MPPSWVLFDLNGTLLDIASVAEPLGGDSALVEEAFQETVLHTMADSLSGAPYRPLPDYLRGTIERRLRVAGRDTQALDAAMERAAAMDPYPEAGEALRILREGGVSTGTLTNSATEAAELALSEAGLLDLMDAVIGTDAAGVFKPHPRVYGAAVERLGVEPDEICLVAAHAWDVSGAMRAGLRAAWVSRKERWLVPTALDPEFRARDLADAARQILASAD